jgi:hypothetical protein
MNSLTSFNQLQHPLLHSTRKDLSCHLLPVRSVDLTSHHLHPHVLFLQNLLNLHQFARHSLFLYLLDLVEIPLVFPKDLINEEINLFFEGLSMGLELPEDILVEALEFMVDCGDFFANGFGEIVETAHSFSPCRFEP